MPDHDEEGNPIDEEDAAVLAEVLEEFFDAPILHDPGTSALAALPPLVAKSAEIRLSYSGRTKMERGAWARLLAHLSAGRYALLRAGEGLPMMGEVRAELLELPADILRDGSSVWTPATGDKVDNRPLPQALEKTYSQVKEVVFASRVTSDVMMALAAGGTRLEKGQLNLTLLITHPEQAEVSK